MASAKSTIRRWRNAMSLRSRESRAYLKALLSGLVVPTMLIALFLASARATYSPVPATPSSKKTAASSIAEAKPPTAVAKPSTAKAQVVSNAPKRNATRDVRQADASPTLRVAVAVTTDPAPMLVTAGTKSACLAGRSYGYSDDDRDFFLSLVEAGEDDKRQTVGTTDDRALRMITRASRRERGKFLYLRIDHRDYIVRDPKTIAAASETVEPMQALGQKMGELGGRQGALGGRQGMLGGEQGALGARHAELAMRQASLSLQIRARERRGLSTAGLEREQRRIDQAMRECSRLQSELGRRQSELGERQSVLGAEQSRYGKEMSRLSAEVDKAMRRLAREAIESGEAEELTDDDA